MKDRPAIGVDPDVALFDHAPAFDVDLTSVRTWKPGHEVPALAFEIVSNADPRKDYTVAPDKYAASGTRELVVFDPHFVGPKLGGGPFLLQVWQREPGGAFSRVHAGDGPARSTVLDAFFVVTHGGMLLRVAADPDGRTLWPTPDEKRRADTEAARSAAEAARARIAELEAELAKRR